MFENYKKSPPESGIVFVCLFVCLSGCAGTGALFIKRFSDAFFFFGVVCSPVSKIGGENYFPPSH